MTELWLDRDGLVHWGKAPRGPDDFRRTTCRHYHVNSLHRAIGFEVPTCVKCVAKERHVV